MAFDNTRAALVEFEKGEPKRSKLWDKAHSMKGVEAAEKADAVALRKVQEAFYLDTKDINSHSNCLTVGIKYLREIADKTEAK